VTPQHLTKQEPTALVCRSNFNLPVEIDKRASLSISPNCDDFFGKIQLSEINSLNGLLYTSCKLVMDPEGFCPKKCNKPSRNHYPTLAGASSCKTPLCAACKFAKERDQEHHLKQVCSRFAAFEDQEFTTRR